nr:restriction endonuclease subunit S [Acinetobacter indicus]
MRFNGFFEVWNTKRLSDLGSIQTGSTPSTSDESYYSKNGLMWVTPTDINGQLVLNTDKKLSILGRKKARIVPPNTILVTCIASIGKNALLLEEGSFNQQINSLTPFERNDPYFLLTQSYFWSIGMQQFAAKGTMQIVNKTQFSNIETFVPSRLEQSSIGNFFQNFDQSIVLHEKKLAQTQNFKKAMLEKMFPKQGNKRPEIRLKGFSGDWEVSKIGDIFEVTSGATPLRSNPRFFENATINWVKTTDLNNGIIHKTEEKVSAVALAETSIKILPKGTVFVAMYGGFNQIGRTGLLSADATCNQALSAIYPNDKVEPYFLLTYLNLKVDSWKELAASSRKDPNITKNDVLSFPLIYPSYDEQMKISKLFKQLDETINLQQQQLQTVKNLKQALLAKMFV